MHLPSGIPGRNLSGSLERDVVASLRCRWCRVVVREKGRVIGCTVYEYIHENMLSHIYYRYAKLG